MHKSYSGDSMPDIAPVKSAIIGSGPAGLTAAIYMARADLKPLVIEGIQPGGQLTITTDVENYPGFPDGISGPGLMEAMKAQAERFGTAYISDEVTAVDFLAEPFKLNVGDQEVRAHTVVIACGATARWLELESVERLRGKGISACATCDGFFFRDQEIAVVGGGDTAVEEATFLTKFAEKVYIIHRRDELRASKIMQKRAANNPKIDIIWDSIITDVLGENSVTGLCLKNVKTGNERDLQVTGLFMGIGHHPNTDIFRGQLDMDSQGYILTKRNVHTSVEGVYACGDVQDKRYRQAVTAAGSGCMAAKEVEEYLAQHEIS
jgi:thioredoxin reductase (NADPH)